MFPVFLPFRWLISKMSTGDMKNNLKKLQKEANAMRYPEDLDYDGLAKGEPEAHLAILYHAFFDYSHGIHQHLSNLGYHLSGKRGNAFVTVVFKIIREKDPALKLTLKVGQFMSKGFAERKIILTTAILNHVRTNLRNACPSKLHQAKRDVNYKSGNRYQVPEFTCPDVSCIKHDLDVNRNFYKDEVPIGAMHSTAVNLNKKPILHKPIPSMQTSHVLPATKENLNYPAAVKGNSLTPFAEIDHAAMLESLPLDSADVTERCTTNTQYQTNQNIASTGNLRSENADLLKRVDSLELQNRQISLHLEEQNTVIKDLQKDNETLKEIIEADRAELKALKTKICQEEDLTARVEELESIITQFKESISSRRQLSIYSPVGGNNLCKQFADLRLNSQTHDVDGTAFVESSLADITNESPLNPTQVRSEKLFELVRDTRSLLGMDIYTPKSNKLDTENDMRNYIDKASE